MRGFFRDFFHGVSTPSPTTHTDNWGGRTIRRAGEISPKGFTLPVESFDNACPASVGQTGYRGPRPMKGAALWDGGPVVKGYEITPAGEYAPTGHITVTFA